MGIKRDLQPVSRREQELRPAAGVRFPTETVGLRAKKVMTLHSADAR